jgi:hypothetical protein
MRGLLQFDHDGHNAAQAGPVNEHPKDPNRRMRNRM